ncbi:MAG: hypothetical protein ACREO8_09030 [Luteimonas sp.]
MQTTRALGPGAGWGWLKQAVHLGRHNPKAIFGAVALLALCALLPSVVQLLLQYGLQLAPQPSVTVVGTITLLMIVLYPLLIGGLLRVIDAAEHGRPTHATALFDTFAAGHGGGRLIGFGVVISAIYIGAFVAVVAAFGPELFDWYMQLLAVSTQPVPDNAAMTAAMAAMPAGLGTVMAFGTIAGLFFAGVYAIGFGQVALGERSVAAALVDGVAGTLKNLLPIIVMAVIAVVALLLFAMLVGGVMALLGAIGALVHPALSIALVLPVYLGMLLVLYMVMFGVMYFMWRDVCAPADAADPKQLLV